MSARPLDLESFSVFADAQAVVRALSSSERLDLGNLPLGALAHLLARSALERGGRFLVIAPDAPSATRLGADLRFFLGKNQAAEPGERVLYYPGADTTPFVDVAPDQRAAMDRLSVLFHLNQGLPWKCLVVPAHALLRKVPPREALAQRCKRLTPGDLIARDELLRLLVEGGYLRVPLVEDAGTFAVRGGLLDIYPPASEQPSRIEFDDELLVSIKRFDPDDQRTLGEVPSVAIHPVRDTLLGKGELAHARQRVSDLCDALNFPTLKRKQLVEDLTSGRRFLGIEGFLPAFYQGLDTLFDYLPDGVRHIVLDPLAAQAAWQEEWDHALRDQTAKVEAKAPVFQVSDLYLQKQALEERLLAAPLGLVHRLALLGQPQLEEAGESMAALGVPDEARLVRVQADDQMPLASALKAQRIQALGETRDPLDPLRDHIKRWLEDGMRVLLVTRTQAQGERLATLLSGYDFGITRPAAFDHARIKDTQTGRVEIVIGPLQDGFVLPSQALVCVTEDEIFGTRQKQRSPERKRARDKSQAFIQDLRELHLGDAIVHIDHGVGMYRGLSQSELPLSRLEVLQGLSPKRVEVLIVEYAGGDKLYLPVTRLNQIDKLASQDGKTPKLDRLGGQTFARTKSRVRASIRQLADELLQLYAMRAARERPPYPPRDRLYAEFEACFPYEETADQARAIDEVMADLEGPRPMDRLVCGDVGFGKTEVALRAAFRAAMSGRQVAVLCPTTVLAQQHLLTFRQRLSDYPVRIEMLSRFVPSKEQSKIIARLKDGQCDIVIGTHRMLSKDVHFARLGLLVVDEEQRFGVGHKERIKKLRTEVDVLSLSATPIPRTLQMAIGGLRELSLITTAPLDRRAVRTFVSRWDEHVLRDALKREFARGGQVFFVHNRIDSLYERAARIQDLVPEARIGIAHGRLRETTLERVMTDFIDGRYDVLACTSIVENGLDIPRANTILIDRADIFGLSQLYQLRGRVGRSRERAYCYLIAPPLVDLSNEARSRIEALERFSQLGAGFQVASLDMELRGAGDLLGEEQSGNLAAVGFDLFVELLQEAIAELRGESVVHEVEPELTFDVEHYIPDDYVADVGLRLSFYKRFAAAVDEDVVHELAVELEDRFGKAPPPVQELVRVMACKPKLREIGALGCDAGKNRVTFHFSHSSPLDPAGVAKLVARSRGYQLTPEGKLICRFEPEAGADPIDRVLSVLKELLPLRITQ